MAVHSSVMGPDRSVRSQMRAERSSTSPAPVMVGLCIAGRVHTPGGCLAQAGASRCRYSHLPDTARRTYLRPQAHGVGCVVDELGFFEVVAVDGLGFAVTREGQLGGVLQKLVETLA